MPEPVQSPEFSQVEGPPHFFTLTEGAVKDSVGASIRFAINGRFLGQRLTGVQRVAGELLCAIDQELAAAARHDWCLLAPPDVHIPPLQAIKGIRAGKFGRHPHWWEQMTLPAAGRGLRVVNLSGGAAWRHTRQSCLLHDAAVFDTPDSYRPVFRWWYRALFNHLARSRADLLTVSQFSRMRLALNLKVPDSEIEVIRSGADHASRVEPLAQAHAASLLQRLGLLPGQPYFLCVGSSNPNKNHGFLFKAWKALPGPRTALVVAGGHDPSVFGPTRGAEFGGLVRAEDLSDDELFHLYRGALALLFPSRYEGFGLPPLEAMSCGCPVIASHAVAEVCADAALLLDTDDPSDWTQAMQLMASDEPLRHTLRLKGLARAAQFKWSDAARHLIAHVDSL
jgi:glycosyltransferase involved in cell wall biosynthesis